MEKETTTTTKGVCEQRDEMNAFFTLLLKTIYLLSYQQNLLNSGKKEEDPFRHIKLFSLKIL
jgi:hypothetical protein